MKKIVVLCLAAVSVFAVIGCNLPGSGADWENVVSFKEEAEAALPSFSGTLSIGRAISTWDWGDPIYELYGMLNAEGSLGGYFNLYDTLDWADERFTDVNTSGTAITLQEIEIPIDLGFTDGTDNLYDYVYDYDGELFDDPGYFSRTFGRRDEASAVSYMLYTLKSARDGESVGKTIIQAVYDETTKDLKIATFTANEVLGGDGRSEVVRVYAEGNVETGVFSMKVIRDGTAYDHNLTAYGVSSGETNYYLVKLANNTMDFTQAVYYTFNAAATTEDLQAMDAAGSAAPENDTEGYAATLDEITPFTAEDLPSEADVDDLLETPVAYLP